jgi:hypothetical protein
VIVIPMAVIVVTVTATAIGAGAPLLVVIRPIIAGAGVTPEALPEAVALPARQGTMMPPRTAITGKLIYMSTWRFVCILGIRSNVCGGTRLKCCKREEYQYPSPITMSSPSFLSFQSLLQ